MAQGIEIRIDISKVVASVVVVMQWPYVEFLGELLDAGRVSEAEVKELRRAVATQGERLSAPGRGAGVTGGPAIGVEVVDRPVRPRR